MELRAVGQTREALTRGPAVGTREEAVAEPQERYSSGLSQPEPAPPTFSRSYLCGAAGLTMLAVAGGLTVPGLIWASVDDPAKTDTMEPITRGGPATVTVDPASKTVPVQTVPSLEPSLHDWNIAGEPPPPRQPEEPPRTAPPPPEAQKPPEIRKAPETQKPPEVQGPPSPTHTPARKIAIPAVQKGDYVSHRINFSHLITNADFTDANAATAFDLQLFFRQQGSFLADYTENGRTAAEIIATAAERSKINPWVVLATLEKENSLVSRERQPGRATLRAAMGYAYNDGGSSAGQHSNFTYQVEKGTGLLRELYDEGHAQGFPLKLSVDFGKRNLTVRNAATYALMRYTPHTTDTSLGRTGGGNYLFERSLTRFQSDYARYLEP